MLFFLKFNKEFFLIDSMEKALVFIDAGFTSKVSLYFGGGIPLKYKILKFKTDKTYFCLVGGR